MTRNDTVAIVFFQESTGLTPMQRAWQERNPAWRKPIDEVIICPVCGLPIRAVADVALLDADSIQDEIRRYRQDYLRAACSNHAWPPEEYWAVRPAR